MDEITIYQNVYKTVLDMLGDRNFSIPDKYSSISLDEFKILFQNKQLDIYIDHASGNKKCYVKFIHTSKIRPNILREYIQQIKEEYLPNSDDQLIIVLKHKLNNTLLKIPKDPQFKFVQLFWMKHLFFNITKYDLVPQFERIPDDEIDELLKQLHITSKIQLPVMLVDDPISKYYAYTTGTVCKITRKSPSAGKSIHYRCIK
jgi:DNA-directed RNA polymerase subunit H